MGNRLTHTENINGTVTPYSYTYDELSRLTRVTNTSTNTFESYSYDPLGNRLTKSDGVNTLAYVYDAANQLNEIRQGSISGSLLASLSYDLNGNLTTKTEATTTTTLTYDSFNRLTQADKTGLGSQSYTYDDQGRRIQKTAGSILTNFLYNGPDIVSQYDNAWASPTAVLTHGPNMDEPIIRATITNTQYYHQDGLGSVVGVSNGTGTTEATARYDAWGNPLSANGATPQYGYTGREPDETGLIYYRARYYDPSIGRFIQRDLIGMNNGVNLYAYVTNNPINFNDPLGLTASPSFNNTQTDLMNYFNTADLFNFNDTEPGAGSGVQLMLTSGSQSLSPEGGQTSPSIGSPILDVLQFGLDIAGLVPGFGEPADLANAGISALRGDPVGAGLSLGAMIPFAGIGATIGKFWSKADNVLDLARSPGFIAGATVESFGKVVGEGIVDLRPTLSRIGEGIKLPFPNDATTFLNKEGLLPKTPAGYYTEFVHPTPGIPGTGPQRIVTGKGGEIYYTPDHYKTFTRIK